jgi:hypothetical protein
MSQRTEDMSAAAGVWRGRIQRAPTGEEFIGWKRIHSEFQEG